jgi:hypothetical protein
MSNLAAFPPSAFDAANDFLSVAPATFQQAAFRVGCDFFSSNHCARLRAGAWPIFGGVSVMVRNVVDMMIVQYEKLISRTCDFVHTSLPTSARLVTVGSKAVGTTYLRPRGRGDDREVVSATASVNGGWRVRLNDKSNASELSQAPSNPIEPKTLTGSSQNRRAVGCLTMTWGTRTIKTAGVRTGTKSFVSSYRNVVNPPFRLPEAGVIARCAAGMSGRGCWKKRTPFCNGTDRGCNIAPPCKRADFQLVMRDERTNRTFTGGNRK